MKVERPRARSSDGADAREQPVDDADMGARSAGTIGPHLRHDGDQRVLAQEGRLTAHVRDRSNSQIAAIALAVMRRQITGIGNESSAGLAAQRLFHHRMTAAVDGKHFVDVSTSGRQ